MKKKTRKFVKSNLLQALALLDVHQDNSAHELIISAANILTTELNEIQKQAEQLIEEASKL